MEYLRTPDVGNHPAWPRTSPPPSTKQTQSPDPKQLVNRLATNTATTNNNVNINPSVSLNLSSSALPNQSLSDATPAVHITPRFPGSTTPFFSSNLGPGLDRAGIKNSFQSLFNPSPNVVTPALMRGVPSVPTPAPPTGLTPFINAVNTPNLIPPNGLSPARTTPGKPSPSTASANPNEALLSSPFLQAAAKEAVRREFMNMPTYVAPSPSERAVPPMRFVNTPPVHSQQQQQQTPVSTSVNVSVVPTSVPSISPGTVIPPPTTPPKFVSPNSGDAKVPGRQSSENSVNNNDTNDNKDTIKPDASVTNSSQPLPPNTLPTISQPIPSQQAQAMAQMQAHQQQIPQFFVPPGHPAPPGMMVIGQHPHMMIAPPPGAIYAPPPGMMMFPGGQMFPQPGMIVPATARGNPEVVAKPESTEDRKARIEHEKQELIREFKKKTREAALVRFRQKRRERRFDKLIRYDCRKKLADARPRVKGRFVRVKNGEGDEDEISEGAQIVPELDDT